MSYKLGFDTGGTYTDAVIIDAGQKVVASAKSLTTHADLIQGLRRACHEVLSTQSFSPITLVSLSTTLATNALVEGHGRRVALILIGYTPVQMQRARLAEALGNDSHVFIDGGHRSDGQEAQPLDTASLERFICEHRDEVDAFAVSSMFSVRNPSHEQQAQALVQTLCDKPLSCGHELSSALDAPRRALTALLNARLIPMIGALLDAAKALLDEVQIDAPLMIVKGDGSLIHADVARLAPVETILSGPAASVVGAQHLLKQTGEPMDVVVSDMGGTTTDVAVLENGLPKLDPNGATVGGWRTMVNAVAVQTFGLGGDSQISFDRELRQLAVGPLRVLPLSRLALEFPSCCAVMERQLEHGWSRTHDGQFALLRGEVPDGLTGQQKELCAVLGKGPAALQDLFKDQTLDRAMNALVRRGVVQLSGFTPTDACHVLGEISQWNRDAAVLGAALLARYSAENLGAVYADETELALSVKQRIAELSAVAIVETLLQSPGESKRSSYGVSASGLSPSQLTLLRRTFSDERSDLQLSATIRQPVMALGAPAQAYYPAAAQCLNTRAILHEHASIANALGAVAGSVKQQVCLTLSPAGGKRVRVHAPEGPQIFDTLDAAAEFATQRAESMAREKSRQAGADTVQIDIKRSDNAVEDNGNVVFFGSEITAIAAGRPTYAIE